jgi:uncharacterized protein YwqG
MVHVIASPLAARPFPRGEEPGDLPAKLDAALAALPIGASRFGGVPDLPAGTEWPERDGVPMEFVAQIALADVAHLDPRGRLPSTGHLVFFYNSQWSTSDMQPDAACCAVLHVDGPLERATPPRVEFQSEFTSEPQLAPFLHGLASLRFETHPSVPMAPSPFIGPPLDDYWQDFTAEHWSSWSPGGESYTANHLLGYVDAQDYVDAQTAADQLLLQIDSDGAAEFQWGDCDRLYFVMTADELAARDFSKVRLYSLMG